MKGENEVMASGFLFRVMTTYNFVNILKTFNFIL